MISIAIVDGAMFIFTRKIKSIIGQTMEPMEVTSRPRTRI